MRRLTVLLFLWVCYTLTVSAQANQTIEVLRTETTENLKENLLPFWMKHVMDPAGGFYGVVMNDGKAIEKAPKGAVLNARILWTFSRAYRQYGLEIYKQMADRAAGYFMHYFIDPTYGGVFWQLDYEGYPKDATKQTYACAFGIYGLAEHFRATGDHRSLEAALKLYNTLEVKVHDKARLGYIESFQRDYSKAPLKGVDGQANATKTMNTPYTDTGILLPTKYVCFRMRSLKKLAAHTDTAPSKPNNTAQKLILASICLL